MNKSVKVALSGWIKIFEEQARVLEDVARNHKDVTTRAAAVQEGMGGGLRQAAVMMRRELKRAKTKANNDRVAKRRREQADADGAL